MIFLLLEDSKNLIHFAIEDHNPKTGKQNKQDE
jgi:hypothetical protein